VIKITAVLHIGLQYIS